MIALRPLVCPVLVGRDELLALAERRIAEVVAGEGRMLLLAGESGMGKTRLLGAIERAAIRGGMRAVRGGTYPSDLRVPGAVLLDLGDPSLGQGQQLVATDEDRTDQRAQRDHGKSLGVVPRPASVI